MASTKHVTPMTSSQKRVILWAAPRTLSTAMGRAMLNSGLKMQYIHEPLSPCYYSGPQRLSQRCLDLPPDPRYTYENAKQTIELPYPDKELVFVQDFPYHLRGRMTTDWIPGDYRHAFITRHPRISVESFMRANLKMSSPEWTSWDPQEVGYKEQVDMLHLLQQQGHQQVVLDADDLLASPEAVLRAFCRQLGLQFRPSMVHWQPMSQEQYYQYFLCRYGTVWHDTVLSKPRLEARPKRPEDISFAQYDQETQDMLEKTVGENMEYYEELRSLRLVV